MRCSKCGTEGIPGKKFCAECGSLLSNRCPGCGSDNAPGAKFCADCGSALNRDVAAEGGKPFAAEAAGGVRVAPERPAGDPLDGERKTVTALFADIKGSMELMEDLDPEEARATSATATPGWPMPGRKAILRLVRGHLVGRIPPDLTPSVVSEDRVAAEWRALRRELEGDCKAQGSDDGGAIAF